jgi:nitroimidazol reductase NimA-like FMN-containing flavoprotein (pyridoxamine 5'-phosphate oxidase superfamily)
MSDTSTPQQRAQRLIDVGIDMTLATVGADGQPWVSPLFYVPDGAYDIYWTSGREARHSENIRATARAAIVIVEPDPEARVDALYMSARAVELNDAADVARGIEIMAAKSQPERWMITGAAEVSGDGPWRIYRAHPLSMHVRETTTLPGGKAVAGRREADFRRSS